jgi:hypothetical protein
METTNANPNRAEEERAPLGTILLTPDEVLTLLDPDEIGKVIERANAAKPGWNHAIQVPNTQRWRDAVMEQTGVAHDDEAVVVAQGKEANR